MSDILHAPAPEEPIRLAIDLADTALADRIAAALAGVAGIELVGMGDGTAQAVLAAPSAESALPTADQPCSPRELEVLGLLAEGASNKEIARRLGISAHTVKFHVRSVMDKLDAVSRTDAVAHAARLGVIEL